MRTKWSKVKNRTEKMHSSVLLVNFNEF